LGTSSTPPRTRGSAVDVLAHADHCAGPALGAGQDGMKWND
jgi:hypothetical protein